MRTLAVAVLILAARPARATGGFQLDDQSAAGVGMAGAQTAVANDPAAIFYNPAGLGFQPGFGALAGFYLIVARTHVSPDNVTIWHTSAIPTVFVAQRLGRHISVGLGLYANFGEHFGFPSTWRGRFQGYFVDLTTGTFQPTIAIRPFSWISIGVGFDIVRASFDNYRALQLGGGEGTAHAGGDGTGFGGTVGLMLRLVPRYLNLGFTYRSRFDIDFDGPAQITLPPELAAMQPGRQRALLTIPFPHNFAFGLAGFFGHLIVTAEAKVSLWRELKSLNLTVTDATSTTTTVLPLDLHTAWAFRAGAQYGFLHDHLRVRLGAGFDQSPVPLEQLGPLLPDTDRALVSTGIGVHWRPLSVDVGYLAVVLVRKTSKNPQLIATYDTFASVIAATVTVHFEHVLQGHRIFKPEAEED